MRGPWCVVRDPRSQIQESLRPKYGVLSKVSTCARNRATDHPRRRLTPAPRRVHPGDTSACTRPVAACIAQRRWSVPAFRVARCGAAAPTMACKTSSSSDDLLLLLARLLMVVRSTVSVSVMLESASVIEFCGCATVRVESCSRAAEHGAVDPRLVQLA